MYVICNILFLICMILLNFGDKYAEYVNMWRFLWQLVHNSSHKYCTDRTSLRLYGVSDS